MHILDHCKDPMYIIIISHCVLFVPVVALLHFRSAQAFFLFPGPPNFFLKKQQLEEIMTE